MAEAELNLPELDENSAKTPLTPLTPHIKSRVCSSLPPRMASECLYREGFMVEDVKTHAQKAVLCPYVKQLKTIKHITTEEDYIKACNDLARLKRRSRRRGGTDLADLVQAEWRTARKKWGEEVSESEDRKKWKTTKSAYHKRMTKIFVKILCGVKYMNLYHVAHSKLKLDNILVSDGDLVQVIAFNYQTEENAAVKNRDSVDFSSPEAVLLKRERRLTYPTYNIEKDDVWQLGCIIFMMLAHQLPYEAGSASDPNFRYATSGSFSKEKEDANKECLKKLLKFYKVLPMFTDSAIDLLKKIFKPEKERVSLDDIFRHPWLQEELTELVQEGSLDWFDDTLTPIIQKQS